MRPMLMKVFGMDLYLDFDERVRKSSSAGLSLFEGEFEEKARESQESHVVKSCMIFWLS